MEFSNAFAIAPKGTSLTKTAYYSWATFYRGDRTPIEGAGSATGRSVIARTLRDEPVFARIDGATEDERRAMRRGQPNFFLVFDRLGIDPFTDFFEITLVAEGTVYAAGDTATRELICGGFTGGGSHNAAWAASSGSWAGRGAAGFARGRRIGTAHAIGAAGLRPQGPIGLDRRAVTAAVQRHVLPHEHNFFRDGEHLRTALASLHDAWAAVRAGLGASGEDAMRAREAAAMVAHARWMYHAALQRNESRGMHKRVDQPALDPAQQHRLLIGGLDELWTRPERVRTSAAGGRAA